MRSVVLVLLLAVALVFSAQAQVTIPGTPNTFRGKSWTEAIDQQERQYGGQRAPAATPSKGTPCAYRVNAPDSLALVPGRPISFEVWLSEAGGHAGWIPVSGIGVVDTIRVRVVGADCGGGSSENLYADYGRRHLRLSHANFATAGLDEIDVSGALAFGFNRNGTLYPALWSRACLECAFQIVNGDSVARHLAATKGARTAQLEKERRAADDESMAEYRRSMKPHDDSVAALNAAYESRRRNKIQASGYSNVVKARLLAKKISIGMTAAQVRLAWGAPEEINRTTTAYGVHEQWVYGDSYVYLDNGIVTAFQN
jgi:hypothetical protein